MSCHRCQALGRQQAGFESASHLRIPGPMHFSCTRSLVSLCRSHKSLIYQGRIVVLKHLLAAGANPHYEDDFGRTSFDHAILGDNQKSLELLLKAPNLDGNLLLENMAAYEYDWKSNKWRQKQDKPWLDLVSPPSTPVPSPSQPAPVTSGWL